ncbi:FAD-dependent oxidoreductase [Rhodococcus sp. X156]|uniref:NAD(P)/FAD-dependent oxidoreductase n=1 Tax=Rhodococcus sp. X156 TaxID=2499145 RepID=UPI002407CFC5|nr:FAD-dependent oxidoreductase [Rhodococcus sp. X156]
MASAGARPEHVVVVGAGMVGLSAAWFLQERGVRVTVLDATGVAADASWGNAGWLTPALTLPLPEPAVLRYGLRAMLRPSSPVYVPLTADPRLLRFLVGFARHCTESRWRRALAVYQQLTPLALEAYDALAEGPHPVPEPTHVADPFVAAFADVAEREVLVGELQAVQELGGKVAYDLLDREQTHALGLPLGEGVVAGLRLHGQRFLHPPRFVAALADSVRARGGEVSAGWPVRQVRETASGVQVRGPAGEQVSADAVVLATGARLNTLARPFGVRALVQAGRGYSFTVRTESPVDDPVYFPTQRVACTPLGGDQLRVAGMMELRRPDAPLDPRRVQAIVAATRPMLRGVDWAARTQEWVGSRPCTTDGLPLLGRTRSPRVHVAGGHGMWGVALGPASGRLLADAITGHPVPDVLGQLDPLR